MSLVVLDTNVWLDLLHFHDPRCAPLLAALRAGTARAAMRADCRAEWQRVLDYPQLAIDAGRRRQLTLEFDALSHGIAEPAPGGRPVLPRCADPDDQKFVELACDAAATVLLSRDRELLCLSRRLQRAGVCPVLAPAAWRPG